MKVKIVDIDEFDMEAGLSETRSAPRPTTCSIKSEQYGRATLFNADCHDVLRELPDNCIDSAVIDGPYGIGFMGKERDNFKPKAIRRATGNYQEGLNHNLQTGRSPSMFAGQYDISRRGAVRFQQFCYEWAREVFRVLKPGAMLVSFCSPRMYHRMATGIEDAGFEIRDQMQWLFGTGFPKSHNIGQAIDKLAGAEREVVGLNPNRAGRRNWNTNPKNITLPATEEADYWDGWQTALKPSNEPAVLARKPISEKSIARNVLKFGTGAINIDACRIGEEGGTRAIISKDKDNTDNIDIVPINKGRHPSNTIIDEEVSAMLDDKAKFYYCPKISKEEKHAGCEHLAKTDDMGGNTHPTVKPIALMEYLVKLVTPSNGVCLDIFMGSGTTGIACSNLGLDFIGVDREEEYYEIAKARIKHWQNEKTVA